jgi:hypothetical protein
MWIYATYSTDSRVSIGDPFAVTVKPEGILL